VTVAAPKAILTPDEARRAIYIDFEGLPYHSPALLGWLYALDGNPGADRLVLRQDVLDKGLRSTVGAFETPVEGIHRYDENGRSILQSINSLARQAKKQDRRIVSWSQHELAVVANARPSNGLLRLFHLNYRDGKATAKRWRSTSCPELQMPREGRGGAHTLVRYAEAFGVALPERYDLDETAGRIASVTTALAEAGNCDALNPEYRDQWSDVLFHNTIDLWALRGVVILAADDLSRGYGQRRPAR
jgi:hypothetical protein